ncbi:MAG: hypothetical protein KKI08_03075, partial [Armatimonadetes bacterium]|nr:hypothetical protein [Armatimonadota bacterium]
DDLMPQPVRDVALRITVPKGQALRQVALLDPRHGDQPQILKTSGTGASLSVTVPRVDQWSMVVFELGGAFRAPGPLPKFTEAPDRAEVEAGRTESAGQVHEGPLPPVATPDGPMSRWLYETDTGYWNVSATSVGDGDADNGVAQTRPPGRTHAGWGRSVMGPFPPGAYVAKVRVRTVPDPDGPQRQYMDGQVYLYEKPDETPQSFFFPAEARPGPTTGRLIVDGQYHEYEIPFERKTLGPVSIIGRSQTPEPDESAFFADHIIIEQRQRYGDAELANVIPFSAPAGLAVGGAPGLDVLVVKGLWWETYQLPDALAALTAPERVREVWVNQGGLAGFPSGHADLYQCDVVLLVNADAQWLGYEGRKALSDFVAAGGGLVVLGGAYTLGQGHFCQTLLEGLLPVGLQDGRDLERASVPWPLRPGTATWTVQGVSEGAWQRKPVVYWRHRAVPRDGAVVALTAGDQPVLLARTSGQGRVAVFTGTVLGEPTGEGQPFWQWEGWKVVLANTMRWAATGR